MKLLLSLLFSLTLACFADAKTIKVRHTPTPTPTATATFAGVTTSGDVIQFLAMPY